MSSRSDNLTIRNVSKRFGQTVALENVNLELPGGKLICFLGPSGCGKTTLLRIIAGLEQPSQGEVLLGADELTLLPVHKRNVGMVFQSFALFPHLSVAENIAYGLRIRGIGRAKRRQRADELLELVQLSKLGDRHVSQLSGGQRQRVAMARALALEPSLFLLDEPLSALDAKLRTAMQVELRRLQQRLGITTIIVTHDQEEAMTMADVVVVMGDNEVQQVGTPLDVYRRPRNLFVAGFLGTNNFLPCIYLRQGEVEVLGRRMPVAAGVHGNEHGGEHGGQQDVQQDGQQGGQHAGQQRGMQGVVEQGVEQAGGQVEEPEREQNTRATLTIRPEAIRLTGERPQQGIYFNGRVTFVRDLGSMVETHVDVGGNELKVVGSPRQPTGAEVWLQLPAEDCVVLAR